MSIRHYKESDYASVLNVYTLSKLDELRFEDQQFELIPLDKDLTRLALFKASDVIVYEDSGVIGFGASHGCEIRSLFVHPIARGKGVGRGLLEHMLSRMTGPVTLNVAKSNITAKSLYAMYGFEVVDEFEATYNGVKVLANTMMRPL
ncbi:GNAT family N-acetyltransferase [Crenobacter oryzisoli]|uniref:GNAT family N-acetyltransferase n=1 Tax=Crenobacter oryzisoli TaxID=3056844 RepID=UPI003204C70C